MTTESVNYIIASTAMFIAILVGIWTICMMDRSLSKVQRLHKPCCDSSSPHWNDCGWTCVECGQAYPCVTIQTLEASPWTRSDKPSK